MRYVVATWGAVWDYPAAGWKTTGLPESDVLGGVGVTTSIAPGSWCAPVGRRHGGTQEPQNALSCAGVLDINVLEQTAVCPHNVIRPGPHLSPYTAHAPRTPVPHPRFVACKEVNGYVLQTSSDNSHRDLFPAADPIWRC